MADGFSIEPSFILARAQALDVQQVDLNTLLTQMGQERDALVSAAFTGATATAYSSSNSGWSQGQQKMNQALDDLQRLLVANVGDYEQSDYDGAYVFRNYS